MPQSLNLRETQPIQQISNNFERGSDYSIRQQYERYNAIRIKLELLSEMIYEDPAHDDEAQDIAKTLLQEQSEIVADAVLARVSSFEHVMTLMKLWENEVVQGQSIEALTPADRIVKVVFDYLRLIPPSTKILAGQASNGR